LALIGDIPYMTNERLSKKVKSPQAWRQKKKKYFLHRRTPQTTWPKENGQFAFARRKTKNHAKFKLLSLRNLRILAFFIVLLGLSTVILFVWISHDLPDPNRLIDRQIAQSTKIYDRTGQTILYEIHGGEKRTLVNLNDIPDYVKNATIAIEDKDFYKHGGFSLWAIFRTVVTDIIFHKTAGASTLTQQFIKNAILTNEKTFTRKIKEIILAYQVEKKFSKDEILQMYLNEIPYGSTAYGVEAASQKYFGKSVKNINLAEAAILAALPQAPTRYSPYGPNKDLLIARQQYILDLMVKQNYITKDQAIEAKNYKLVFKEQTDNIIAPHFVMYIKDLLANKYGETMIEQEGLKIYTTLDLYKQKIAEQVIDQRAPANQDKYQASNAALVSIDPKTGQILAMVGSKNYFDDSIDGQVNVALMPRQPGSSFKPIVYTAAFAKGYTPDTILYDVVTNFSNDPANPYEPHNYDDKEHGPVTMRQALAGSLNIPAVKTIYLTGIDNVLNLADKLGYTTLSDRSRFGLSLVLGGGEVKLLEHTNAFGAFAREGILHQATGILKIEDKNGKVIEEYQDQSTQAIDASIVRLTNSVLSDNSARAFIFGENNYLTLGNRPVAAKTGTTNDYHDAWTIGYTPSLVTGVWVGNNNNSAMKRGADGSIVAAPIWHDYMDKVLGDTPIEYFNPPDSITTGKAVLDGQAEVATVVKLDKSSGLLATEYTPPSFTIEKTFKQIHNILYYVNKDDPRGPAPSDPTVDPQYTLWEDRIQAWAIKQGYATSSPPTAYDNVHLPENEPTLTIESPTNNQSILEPTLSITIKVSAPRGVNRAEYYLNDNLWATVYTYPFNYKGSVNFLNNGFQGLKVKVCDDVENCTEQNTEFNLILSENKSGQSIGVSLIKPSNGVSLTASSSNCLLEASLTNPESVAKVTFYLVDSNQNLVQTVANRPSGNTVQAELAVINTPGNYVLYAKAQDWNNQAVESNRIVLTVK